MGRFIIILFTTVFFLFSCSKNNTVVHFEGRVVDSISNMPLRNYNIRITESYTSSTHLSGAGLHLGNVITDENGAFQFKDKIEYYDDASFIFSFQGFISYYYLRNNYTQDLINKSILIQAVPQGSINFHIINVSPFNSSDYFSRVNYYKEDSSSAIQSLNFGTYGTNVDTSIVIRYGIGSIKYYGIFTKNGIVDTTQINSFQLQGIDTVTAAIHY